MTTKDFTLSMHKEQYSNGKKQDKENKENTDEDLLVRMKGISQQ